MRGGQHNRLGSLRGLFGIGKRSRVLHEDAGADENRFRSRPASPAQRRPGWRFRAEKFGTGSFPALATIRTSSCIRRLMLLGFGVKFFFAQHSEDLHLLHDLPDVLYSVHYVPGTGLALPGVLIGCAFGNTSQGLAQIACAADKGNFEGMLVHMVGFVGRGEDFRLVDIVHAKFLEVLGPRQNARCGTWPSRESKLPP